jgi:DNA-binding NtrC family response regulator
MATARVVIVDDEELLLNAASRILRAVGYEVLPVEEPHQVLEIIRNKAPIDLVIADVVMPKMRGPELIREIARMSPGTATLLITGGLIDPLEVPESAPVLRKPFSAAELVSAASAALDSLPKEVPTSPRVCEGSAKLQD